MKKVNFLLFIIITILIFSSCNQANEPSRPSVEHSGGEIPLFGLYSEDEYNAYMADATLPEHFISYEQLSHLGLFESIVFLEDARSLKFESYLYQFVSGKEEINLYVYHSIEKFESYAKGQSVSQTNTDLRTLPSNESGVYIEQNVIYNYIKGELFSVTWVRSGITYVMYTEPNLSNYKSGNDFINALLIKDEIASAMEIFDQHISSSK